jgi:general secretion pathway protein C
VASVAQGLHLNGELVNQLIARAPRWITVVLVVLLGIRAATLVAHLSGGSSGPVNSAPPPPATTRNVVDVPSILRANLFGQSAPVAGATPVTNMSLVLAAVFADADEKLGLAMIGTTPTDLRVYRVGEAVPGGPLLHAVLVDRVLLDRGGAIEALMIPTRFASTAAPPPQVAMAPNPGNSAARVQQVLRDNPALIGQVIQRQPVLADGKLRGMRVYPGSNAQAFSRLGLRAGDLVTAINGTTLEGQTRAEEIFNSLNGAAEARVTVTRNGSPLELQLNLAEIAGEAERLSQGPATNGGIPPNAPDGAR